MQGREIPEEPIRREEKSYPCVWDEDLPCPIRGRWKLEPESLVQWCALCYLLPLHKKGKK